jgi:peptidoglycan/xylan/chitin deacetylase (PgdA/CDA1 family)
MSQASLAWPNGKKVALSTTIMFEAWSDEGAPSYSVQATQLKAGVVDHAAKAWATYGGRVGVWRLLKMLERLGVPATFFTSGRCAELYPDAVKAIAAAGHDLGAHSYTQDTVLTYLSPEDQRDNIRRSIDLLQGLTGQTVSGWASPAVAYLPETNAMLAEEGLTWHTDVTYLDLPFRIRTPHGDIAGVPTTDFSDNRVLKSNPRDWFDAMKGTLDYLQTQEPMSLLTLVIHCQFGGRALMTAVIEEFLRYAAAQPDVWLTRHKELAAWALQSDVDEHSYQSRFFSGAHAAAAE